MAEPIREDEITSWIAELDRVQLHSDNGFTTQDVARAYKIDRRAATAKVRNWVDRGLVKHVGFKDGLSIDGKRTRQPVYAKV